MSTGALKVQTSPGVWTPVGGAGGIPPANNAETVAGVITDKAVTPHGLTEALPYPDARQHGVVIDGTTDDRVALNAYIADCHTEGRPCYLRSGTYRITTNQLVGKGRIIGAGRDRTIIEQTSLNAGCILFDTQNDWECSDMTLRATTGVGRTNHRMLAGVGEGSGGAMHRLKIVNGGLYLNGGGSYSPEGLTPGFQRRIVIDSVWIDNATEFGLDLRSVRGADLIGVQATAAVLDGIKLSQSCNDVKIIGGYATGCGQEGIDSFMGGMNLSIIGFAGIGNTGNGITVKTDTNPWVPAEDQLNGQTNIVAVICRGNLGGGLTIDRNGSVDDPANWLFAHCTVQGGVFEGNTNAGIKVRARNVSLVGPLVRRNGQQGIQFTPESMDCEVVSPQVTGNGQTTVNTYDGIVVGGTRNKVIGGFSIGKDADSIKNDGDYAALTAQQRYGAVIQGGSTDCQIIDCVTFGNATGDISTFGTRGMIKTRTRWDMLDAAATVHNLSINQAGVLQGAAFGDMSDMAPTLYAKTGEYWSYPFLRSTNATVSGAMYTHPFYVSNTVTVDRIGAEVTTLAAGSTLTLGIYNDDGSGDPGTLLIDAGTIDGGTVAVAEKTISQQLLGGRLYHFAVLAAGGTPTVRTVNASINGRNTTLALAMTTIRTGRIRTGIAGTALPTPAATTLVSSPTPIVAVRIA